MVAYYDKAEETIRCADCLLFSQASSESHRCDQCRLYRKTLFSLLTRHQQRQSSPTDRTDPTSHVNYRFLTSPEKEERLQRFHHMHRIDQQKIARLQAALNVAVKGRGVVVDEDLHQDLKRIIQENEKSISATYPSGSFARLFWENQMRAASVNNARSMQWDPLMIRWCLYLRHLSSSAYEMLRETGLVKLPSQRTLRDYTYIAKAAAGFSHDVDAHLLHEARLDSCERHIILLMDEMHLREDLVYDRHSGLYACLCGPSAWGKI